MKNSREKPNQIIAPGYEPDAAKVLVYFSVDAHHPLTSIKSQEIGNSRLPGLKVDLSAQA
jgi:hypothetical protein